MNGRSIKALATSMLVLTQAVFWLASSQIAGAETRDTEPSALIDASSSSPEENADIETGLPDSSETQGRKGWVELDGLWYYYNPTTGLPLMGELFDDGSWYWLDPDHGGARATGFVYLVNGQTGKWVYYDEHGRMLHGEQYLDGGWYLLDPDTGAVTYGFAYLPKDDKWVYYNRVSGRMQYGEQLIDGGWYYLTPLTGAVDYGWAWLPESNKWVYYDPVSGRMWHGSVWIDGKPYYLDAYTGERLSKQEMVDRLVSIASSQNGTTSADAYVNALTLTGADPDPYGPCMTFVWWCFHQAGFDNQLMDGQPNAWPHVTADWYSSRGRLMGSPEPGDIWLVNQPYIAGNPAGLSATHAGLVSSVEYNTDGSIAYVYVWQHVNGWVHLVREDPYHIYAGQITGYARPYYNE